MTRGLQKPAWQRPMPARVRRLHRPGCGRRAPVDGVDDLPFGDALTPADDLAVGGIVADQLVAFLHGQGLGVQDALAGGVKGRVFFQARLWDTISATMTPMAGLLDRPGDSMPAQSTKPGAISPMKKSCRSSWARNPAKLVMVCAEGCP